MVARFDEVFDFRSHVVKEKVISESSLKSPLARMCASVCQSDSCVLETVCEDNLLPFRVIPFAMMVSSGSTFWKRWTDECCNL